MNYGITKKELLAIVDSVRHFRRVLQGHPVTILMDHQPLVAFMSSLQTNQMMIRWQERLSQLDITIAHINGKKNVIADALYCGIHSVLMLSYYYCSHIVNLFNISIYYDAIPYLMSSSSYSILSVSSVIIQFIALHHTYAHKPVLILVICVTYIVSISHTVLFHITCVYSLPE